MTHSSSITKTIKNHADKFKTVVSCLLKPELTNEDAKIMQNSCHTSKYSLNQVGVDLYEQVCKQHAFYKEVSKIPACKK
eukprot:2456240-Ditylum_brightwellii.AAC.1